MRARPHALTTPPPEARGAQGDDPWRRLGRSFYERDPRVVAPALIGRFLVHDAPEGRTVGRIVETEAYCGPADRAAHVLGDRRTARTEVFWSAGGHAYVYLIYGMHECFNVVTGPVGAPSAVLVRALEPVGGLDLMARRRGRTLHADAGRVGLRDRVALAAGPGRLCQAMGIRRRAHYGVDLTTAPLTITAGLPARRDQVVQGPRVNVAYAGEDALRPWRYLLQGSPFVSKA